MAAVPGVGHAQRMWTRSHGTALALLVSLITSGCSGEGGTTAPPTVGQRVEFTPRERADLRGLGLPNTEDGHPILIQIPGAQLELDPELRDAITALGSCADLLMGCVEPEVRSLDDCFFSAPRCATDTPWNEGAACCPESCFVRYAELRLGGAEELPALETSLFVERTCFPGLVERMREGRR